MTIFENIFRSDTSHIPVKYLKDLFARCRNGDYDEQFL